LPLPRITVFSDFGCPYCYLTEAALRATAGPEAPPIRFHAFELYPAPAPLGPPPRELETGPELDRLAGDLGLALEPPGFRPRTRKAHEAARFAAGLADAGAEGALRAAIFAAYWAEGRDIGRIDVLATLAPAAGIDPLDLKIALDIDRFRDEVVRDRLLAERLGITGVPATFVGTGPEALVLLGAQTPAALDAAIRSR
jgi:predicted DsbA family dithiol-disulfide isomerase